MVECEGKRGRGKKKQKTGQNRLGNSKYSGKDRIGKEGGSYRKKDPSQANRKNGI